jgi:hypothetical protein
MSAEYTRMPVTDLVPDPENPRSHSKYNVDAIRASIETHGQVEPLVVQKSTRQIIGGNARFGVLKEIGYEDVDVVLLDIDDAKARALSISLNRTGELATWDEDNLAKALGDLQGLDDFDFDSLGFDQMEIDHYLSFTMFDDDDMVATELSMEPPPDDHPSVKAKQEFMEKSGGVFVNGSVKGENMNIIPHGTEPQKMAASHIRQVQLHFTVEDDRMFRLYCRRLCDVYGTDNLTDTVFKALINEADKHGVTDVEAQG